LSRIKLIVVGATRSSFLREGESYYLEKLRRYAPTDWVEVKSQKVIKGRSRDDIVRIEGLAIAKKWLADDHIVALDSRGREYNSEGFAALIEQLKQTAKRICFVIGGPLGLSPDVLKRAADTVSLSRLTLTHELTRLVLLEQLYRAHTIIKGEKYHK